MADDSIRQLSATILKQLSQRAWMIGCLVLAVILVTQLDVHGQISVENLTLQAPHFHNAVRLHGPTASAVFLYTAIQPEPTGQFPAVYLMPLAMAHAGRLGKFGA